MLQLPQREHTSNMTLPLLWIRSVSPGLRHCKIKFQRPLPLGRSRYAGGFKCVHPVRSVYAGSKDKLGTGYVPSNVVPVGSGDVDYGIGI